jgi:hypothetical protein
MRRRPSPVIFRQLAVEAMRAICSGVKPRIFFPTAERCVQAYYLHPTRFESIAERKVPTKEEVGFPLGGTEGSNPSPSSSESSANPTHVQLVIHSEPHR